MKKPLSFTPVDLYKWKRGEQFYYFAKMAPTGYSMTVEVDVTHMRSLLKEKGIKFFPAYLWLVTKCLMEQPDVFALAQKEDKLGYYNSLTPLYAHFHKEEETFSFLWTEFDDDFSVFYRDYLENARLYGENRGVLGIKDRMPPENAYTVSCVPWVGFSHFAVHSYENKPYYFPSVEAGKLTQREGRVYMPLSLSCHHATTDGIHIRHFLDSLQGYMDAFERFLPCVQPS